MNAALSVEQPAGVISQATQRPSPNHDARSEVHPIDLLVIHGISLPPSQFGGPYIDQLFTNTLDPAAHPYFEQLQGLTVSAHLLITRTGELIQYVPFSRRAWHAGVSQWGGRTACNDFSIGIELEGCDFTPYTDAQYTALLAAAQAIRKAYPAITADRVVGHCHIAPGRKTDPGPYFDWARLRLGLIHRGEKICD